MSPPLVWSGVPDGAITLLLTCDDPDAPRGVFHHWAAYNIDASVTCLAVGEKAGEEAVNDFGRPGYGGPCPPPGDLPHRYVFRLIALDVRLEPGRDLQHCPQIAALARGHELARAELIGRFGR